MGKYVSRATDNNEFKQMISLLRNGYASDDGVIHRPNNQIADILVLEANLGCRLGDILKLKHDDFVCDCGIWKINIIEEKTDKKRTFIVPKPIKDLIDNMNYGKEGYLFSVGEQAVWKQLRAVTAKLGLKNVSSHSLRKMISNQLYEASGHDIELVCEYLQHSSISITRRYIRRTDKQLEDAINNVMNIL